MKLIYVATVFVTFFFFTTECLSQTTEASTQITTYYFIRHAEKDRSDISEKNPGLNIKGQERAENWTKLFEKVDFNLIYATTYKRTQQTALPIAKQKGIAIKTYNPRTLYTEAFKNATQGKTVLVVGHSNTTPAFVNAIIGADTYPTMSDKENGVLYIVTMAGIATKVQVLQVD